VSPLKARIQKRYDQLTFETDVPPNIILVESGDINTGSDYAFIEARGLLSRYYSKWTRKWTNVLDLRTLLDTSKYTFNSNQGPKTAPGKRLRTDSYR